MRWRDVTSGCAPSTSEIIRSEQVAGVYAEIVTFPSRTVPPHMTNVWRALDDEPDGDVSCQSSTRHATLDEAKAAALEAMRAAVIAARGEAQNTICEASRWLRLNGGEP